MTDAELQRLLVLDADPGPALAIDPARADAIVDAALDGAGFPPGGGGGGAKARESGGSPSGGASGGAAVGTKVAVAVGIAVVVAAIVLVLGRNRRGGVEYAPSIVDAAIVDTATGSGTLAVSLPDAAPAATDPPRPVPFTPVESSPPAPPAPTPARPKAAPRESAADLLGEANAKRAAKQWRESDALYARVVAGAPKSLAAQTALIASASLRLEHLGDPKGALQRFRRALAIAPTGVLAEDARWGIAEAARALHDRSGEAAALDDFLRHHAGSALAPRAKARRAELP